MKDVKVHTAICTICNRRNKDIMKRCPGCTWQICKLCREKRESEGRSLMHSNMGTPGSLGSALGSRKVERRVLGMQGSPTSAPSPTPVRKDNDTQEDVEAREKTVKRASRKRMASGKKSKAVMEDESDEDDDFMPDPASPISHKRRRTTHNITDTPTATSARPSRTIPTTETYVDPASPPSSQSSAVAGHAPYNLNSAQVNQGWGLNPKNVAAPTGPIQELLEGKGVNTSGNRYEEHLLARYNPVVTNPVISIPEAVKRMSERTPRMTAVQKLEAKKERFFQVSMLIHSQYISIVDITQAQVKEAEEQMQASTVRGVAEAEAIKHQNQVQGLSDDETEEFSSAIKEAARKWAGRTYDVLSPPLQNVVKRSLDLRLDRIDRPYTVQLLKVIEECANRKFYEFAQDRGAAMSGSQ
jgi:hypothetical protein